MNKQSNPHIRRMQRIASKSGLEYSKFDVSVANEKGFKVCGQCGHKAYFKPTVGTFVCYCGSLMRDGQWTPSKYQNQ